MLTLLSRSVRRSPGFAAVLLCCFGAFLLEASGREPSFELRLRSRLPDPAGAEESVGEEVQTWEAAKTAVIVCDVWDVHHCLNATRRVAEMAPRMDALVREARDCGALIIHAPSSCMPFYRDHPARQRAEAAPPAHRLPEGIADWLHWIDDREEAAGYPIDATDGGEDDDSAEHAQWQERLRAMGRDPGAPWIRQSAGIFIDPDKDAITDSGIENWNLLEARGVENVIVLGVHTNMCVLGRPFGLRQLARNGKNVVLVRDLTDTMYNPERWPRVSHFQGTDLVIAHVERHVCPTISSDQILGGAPASFRDDRRPHLVILASEPEYRTAETLPRFAQSYLEGAFRLTYVLADPRDADALGGVEAVRDADLVLVSVRRRQLPEAQLAVLRDYVASGRPVAGIRTASHAFSPRGQEPGPGRATWETFDGEVLGGNYRGHTGNELATSARARPEGGDHPVLRGLETAAFPTGGSLYLVSPLAQGAEPLLLGRVAGQETQEPVAWTFRTPAGGRVFYTSLGDAADFGRPEFRQLLANGLHWAAGLEVPAGGVPLEDPRDRPREQAAAPEGDPAAAAEATTQVAAAPPAGADEPLPAEASHARMQTPPDLAVDLLLAEPVVRQPLHLSFDERGRLWVVQYLQYPEPAGLQRVSRDAVWRVLYDRTPPPPPYPPGSPFRGQDRITIHEDTDGDGDFDDHKVFLEGLNLATSVARGRGGVWVTQPPYLLFYPDRDDDDVPDGPPEVRLQGFGIEDTHSVANSLTWGPDGWLYGAQGSTVSAAVLRPGIDGGDADAVKTMGQNIWRYHPERRIYEVFAEGGGNAFGVEIDASGRVYSGHNGGDTRGFHYVQGGYYRKGFEKHGALSNPYAFGYFSHMEHHAVERFTHQFLIYEGNALPERWCGLLWGVDVMHGNLVASAVEPHGSTFRTRDIDRPLTSGDPWFRPVHVADGPDGALYVADWYDRQVNHYRNHEGQMDHERGRVYRVRDRNAVPAGAADLRRLSSEALTDLLRHPSRWHRRTALRLLADRGGQSVLPRLVEMARGAGGPEALEAVWALYQCGGWSEDLALELLGHADPRVRRWSVRLLGDERTPSARVAEALASLAQGETDPEVRSQLASTARRFPPASNLAVLRRLAERAEDAADPHQPLLLWWALEAACGQDPDAAVALFEDAGFRGRLLVRETLAPRLMQRLARSGTRRDFLLGARLLDLARGEECAATLLAGLEEAYRGRPMPPFPEPLARSLAAAGSAAGLPLRVRQGDEAALREALRAVADAQGDRDRRIELVAVLGQIERPEVEPVLLDLLEREDDAALRKACLEGLQHSGSVDAGRRVLELYPRLDPLSRRAALSLLTRRSAWAAMLLDAADAGRIDPAELSLPWVRKLQVLEDAALRERVEKRWGEALQETAGVREEEIIRLKTVLSAAEGVPKQGEALYAERCGACHTLFARGGAIGPDLTSYQRQDLDTLLLSVVAPSAEVREGFEHAVVRTRDGEVISGFLADQDPRVLVVRDLAGSDQVVERGQVAGVDVLPTSLMPGGLLDGLTEQQTRDLFAYLRSTTPPF